MAAQLQKAFIYDEDHKRNRDQQRDFDVAQRGADRFRAIDGQRDVDRRRDGGLELRQDRDADAEHERRHHPDRARTAADPACHTDLDRLRQALRRWVQDTADPAVRP